MKLSPVVIGALVGLAVSSSLLMSGCDRTPGHAAAPSDGQAGAAAKPGYFAGRVTFADGSPIRLPGVQYDITIGGTTEVGEAGNFKPEVAPDGTFTLRLLKGLFKPPYGFITVPFEGKKYRLHLDPVAPFTGRREGAAGIAQNFIWRLTGPQPGALNPDTNNATHWFGSTIPLVFSIFRDDISQVVKPLPGGSKITWALKPISKCVDGSEIKPFTVARTWREGGSFDALNDLPPANYEVAAFATLPDGSKKLVVLKDMDDRRYKPKVKLVLQPDENLSHYVYLPRQLSWAVE